MSVILPDRRSGIDTLAALVRSCREVARSNPERRRIYIAGPISGLPDRNAPAFTAAEADLRSRGLHTVNPLRLNSVPWVTWAEAMRVDIAHLVLCDSVALLPGWEQSRGVGVEMQIAHALQIEVRTLEQWLTSLPVLRHRVAGGGAA